MALISEMSFAIQINGDYAKAAAIHMAAMEFIRSQLGCEVIDAGLKTTGLPTVEPESLEVEAQEQAIADNLDESVNEEPEDDPPDTSVDQDQADQFNELVQTVEGPEANPMNIAPVTEFSSPNADEAPEQESSEDTTPAPGPTPVSDMLLSEEQSVPGNSGQAALELVSPPDPSRIRVLGTLAAEAFFNWFVEREGMTQRAVSAMIEVPESTGSKLRRKLAPLKLEVAQRMQQFVANIMADKLDVLTCNLNEGAMKKACEYNFLATTLNDFLVYNGVNSGCLKPIVPLQAAA